MSSDLSIVEPTSSDRTLRVATLGPPGTYGEVAAKKFFASHTSVGNFEYFSECSDHDEVCDRVQNGEADFGVVAIENSIGGIVNDTLRSVIIGVMADTLRIVGEHNSEVRHFLGTKDGTLQGVKIVYSHYNVKVQCRNLLRILRRSKGIVFGAEISTASAAIRAAAEPYSAAIASQKTLEDNGLQLVDVGRTVADFTPVQTRFWIVGSNEAKKFLDTARSVDRGSDPAQQKYKTSLVLNLERNEPGVLHKVLSYFKVGRTGDISAEEASISLAVLHPAPRGRRIGEYHFFVELECHENEIKVARQRIFDEDLANGIFEAGCYVRASQEQ